MGIIAFEGASAVGKSTTCRELEKNYGAYIIPEVNFLFERPKNEHRTWYFEKHLHISKSFQRYYENVNTVTDGYCKMIDAKSVKSNELEIVKSLNSLNVCEERRFDVSRLDAITKWLKEHRA
ncbi:hypothetical protein [Bacillus fungorum]|uniref:hypothetical protein n=1 Tax=Bacillus fungorum TaxID=2039284 RepID=UPI003F572806